MTCSRRRILILCAATTILLVNIFGPKPTHNEISAYRDEEKNIEYPDKTRFGIVAEPYLSTNASMSNELPAPPPTTPPPKWASILVRPQVINLTSSDSFIVGVDVINVTNLAAYEFKLIYNTTIVSVTEVKLGDFFPRSSFVVRKGVYTHSLEGEETEFVGVATCGPLGSDFKANGNGTLATIRFKAISTGSCVLKLYQTLLLNDCIEDIAHNVIDGYVQCKIYEHEITAYLNAPIHLQPGAYWLLNASAVNKGLCNETNVDFQLLIDGEVVNSTMVDLLEAGSSVSLTYLFSPSEERVYNVTSYVKPLPNEEHTQNNKASTNVLVRTQIRVPQDYAIIQEAIDAAVSGETIIVASGVYHEHIGIDKSLRLLGENCSTTIIDGDGEEKVIVVIGASEVELSGFEVRNGAGGILLEYSNNSIITGNVITDTMDGFSLMYSHNNTIISNTIKDNEMGIFVGYSNNNTIHHNSFISNIEQAVTMDSNNLWDNHVEGNYWSDYEGEDSNADGIGDTPYVIDEDNKDNYPIFKQKLN